MIFLFLTYQDYFIQKIKKKTMWDIIKVYTSYYYF